MSPSAQAAIMRYHGPGGLTQWKFVSLGSGGWKAKFKVLADSAPSERALPGLQVAAFLLLAHQQGREKDREGESERARELWFLFFFF